MILVNLLPHELRPVKRTPIPYIVVAGLIIAIVFFLGSTWLGLFTELNRVKGEISAKEAELTSLQHIVDEYNALSDSKIALQDKVQVIEEILQGRKIWSEHLQRLTALTPDNYWYDTIKETTKTIPTQVIKKDEKTGKPLLDANGREIYETKRVKTRMLEISGYTIRNEEGNFNVFELSELTSSDEGFNSHFVLESPTIEDTEFDGFEVRRFTLEYIIQQGGQS